MLLPQQCRERTQFTQRILHPSMNRSISILASCRNIYVPYLSQRDPSSAFYISRYRILPLNSLLESLNPTPPFTTSILTHRPIKHRCWRVYFAFPKSIVEMVWVVGSEVEGRRVCVIGCLG